MIAVARKGEAPLRQIAKDFGVSEACLHRWLKIADREGRVDGTGATDARGECLWSCAKRVNGSSSSSRKPRSGAVLSGI
ncbi:MAG: transposase family protein [Mycobacterium sp.]|nr:transposase family protein [Mycobacterium sp.]